MKKHYKAILSITIFLCIYTLISDHSHAQSTSKVHGILDITARYGTQAKIVWDNQNNTAKIIRNIVHKSPYTDLNLVDLARDFIEQNSIAYGSNISEVKLRYLNQVTHNGITHVDFFQTYKNLRVYESLITVSVSQSRAVRSASSNVYRDIDIDIIPKLSNSEAIEVVRTNEDIDRNNHFDSQAELVISSQPSGFVLSYLVKARHFEALVDASTGKILGRSKSDHANTLKLFDDEGVNDDKSNAESNVGVKESSSCTITGVGYVYLTDPGPPSSQVSAVQRNLPRLCGTGSTLDGKYITVKENGAYSGQEITTVPGSSTSYDFRYSFPNYTTKQASWADNVNVYYHLDKFAHDYWKNTIGYDPPFKPSTLVFYSGSSFASIPFSRIQISQGNGPNWNNARKDEVMYHEYTHLLTDHIGFARANATSPTEHFALNEGYSDYFASSYTNDPNVFEWVPNCTCTFPKDTELYTYSSPVSQNVRTLLSDPNDYYYDSSNPFSFPDYGYCETDFSPSVGDDVCVPQYQTPGTNNIYALSMVWSGALWSLRSSLGAQITDQLVFNGLLYVHYPTLKLEDALVGLLIADAELYNGTHTQTIRTVMANRGIEENGISNETFIVEGSENISALVSGGNFVDKDIIIMPGATAVANSAVTLGSGSSLYILHGSSSQAKLTLNGALTVQSGATVYLAEDPNGSSTPHLDVTSSGSITVNSGGTFTVKDGNRIHFASGKSVTIYGTFDVLASTNSNRAILTASSPSVSWYGLKYKGGSNGDLVYVDLTELSGGAGSGAIAVDGSALVTLDHAFVDVESGSYVFGVSTSSGSLSSSISIGFSTIRSASGPAIYASGTGKTIYLHDTDVIQTSGTTALQAVSSAKIEAWFPALYFDGRNKIKGGKTYATGSAIVDFGVSYNLNHYCNSASAYLQTASSGTIYAGSNYWYNGVAPTTSGTNIYTSPILGTANCSDVLYRMSTPSASQPSLADLNQVSANGKGSDANAKLFEAKSKIPLRDFDAAISLLKSIVQSPEAVEAQAALLELRTIYQETSRPEVQGFVRSLANQKNNPLALRAKQVLADIHILDRDWDAALSVLEELQAELDPADAFFATLSMAYIYQELGKREEAMRLLGQIQTTRAEESEVLAVALSDFAAEGQNNSMRMLAETLLREAQAQNSDEQGFGSKLGAESYPNPFNPSTTIRFTLPSESTVKLYVFDILGRQVATLVDGVLKSGSHQAVFDASHLASGLYMYRLEALGEVITGTMQLLK